MAATKKPKANRPVKTTVLFTDEVYWATVLAKLTGSTVAKVMSPLVRNRLRRELKTRGIDPDVALAEASRNGD